MKTPFPSFVKTFDLPPELGKAALVGLCLYFLAGLADGALLPFFALWARKDAGIPTGYIGLLLACYAGGELLATPWLGGIADRIGRRPVLLLSTTGVGGGFLLLYFTHGISTAALCLLLIGIFESVLHPTIAAVIVDTVPTEHVRRHFALTHVASNLGHIVGPALGALLALLSLGAVFIGCGISLLVAALLVAGWLPETWTRSAATAGHREDDDDDDGLSGLLPAFRDRRLAALLLWFAVLEIAGSWIESVLPLYAHDTHVLTASGVGWLFTYSAAVIVLFQLWISKQLANLSGFSLVVISGVALAAGFAVLVIHPGVVGLVIGVTLFAVAQMLFGPLIPTTVNELAPPSGRATYMAAISVTQDLKDTLGPATGTLLYAASARLPWFVGMPVVLSAAAALATTVRRHERGQASQSPKVTSL